MKEELLTVKELAWELKRSTQYVYQMRSGGFVMVGGRSTLKTALNWIEKNNFHCKAKKLQRKCKKSPVLPEKITKKPQK